MIRGLHHTSLLLLLILMMASPLAGQPQEKTRILFVLDASNSMNGQWQSKRKIDVARDLLTRTLDELKGTPGLELALRAYGHGSSITHSAQDCDDTELLVPFGPYRYKQIGDALEAISPQGTTPIARSLERSAADFPDTQARNIIILITDGIEACDEDPCAVSLALQRRNVVLKPFVIGIGLDNQDRSAFECIGNFYDASSEQTFETVLKVILSQALDNTTAQVNLLDAKGMPTETNVTMTFSDSQTGSIRYQYVHTMNKRGNPDTLTLDPVYTYDLTAHTLPPVSLKSQSIKPGEHTTLVLNTPQGTLDLQMEGRNGYKDLKCLVRASQSQELIHVQSFNTRQQYIAGTIDLEVLTLPRTRISQVSIKPGLSTPIIIAAPGVLNLDLPSAGYGCIQQVKGDKLEWVCIIDEQERQQQFVLQPGTYRVVFRSRNSKQSLYTLEEEFKITSESSVQIQF